MKTEEWTKKKESETIKKEQGGMMSARQCPQNTQHMNPKMIHRPQPNKIKGYGPNPYQSTPQPLTNHTPTLTKAHPNPYQTYTKPLTLH